MSENVYIIGAGIHPFGRTDSRSGREQGVYAVREALSDAGLEWPDIECAYGGSAAAGNADIGPAKAIIAPSTTNAPPSIKP